MAWGLNEPKSFPQKLVAFVALVVTPAGRYLFEGLARVAENSGGARFRLIAPDNDIDVEWIELDATAHPTGILGGDQSRPGSEEGSRTISPRVVRSISVSCSIAVGFTVG
jgi:hypothetical protein